jgi:hypothetical protein
MQITTPSVSGSILNSNDSQVESIKNNFTVIPMKKEANEYVASFNSFAVKTAQSTLEMCRVVYEAKHELPKAKFDKFCTDIGRKVEEEDSTIRKYLAIGERYDEFIAYADRMPDSWTSIYLITTIPSDKLLEMVNDAKSLKSLTAQQIKKMISDEPASTDKKSIITTAAASIYFEKEPTIVEWNSFKMHLNAIAGIDILKIKIEYSNKFENLHKESKKANSVNAKMKRKKEKESQKRIDEQDFVYNPMFDYGGAYDFDLGKFIS